MSRLPPILKVVRSPNLAQQVADVIRAALERGEFRHSLPAERQLARRLKISRGTLRLALDALKAQGLLSVHHKRTLVRSRIGASVHRSKNRKVALLLPERLARLPAGMLLQYEDLHRHLQDSGYELELIETPLARGSRVGATLEGLIRGAEAGSWILSRCSGPVQRFFAQKNIPAIVAGHAAENIPLPSVDYDYAAISRHAAGVFLSRGHRQLAYFGNAHPSPGDLASIRGFQEGMAPHAQEVKALFFQHDTPEAIARAMVRAQKQCAPPTAIFVSRPPAVITILCSLAELGLRIGRDISLISRQVDSCLDPILPAIAHYRTDFRRFASRTVRLVVSLEQNPDMPPAPIRLIASYQPGHSVTQLLK